MGAVIRRQTDAGRLHGVLPDLSRTALTVFMFGQFAPKYIILQKEKKNVGPI